MTLPFKLQVLHALTDAFKTITPANGYQFNLADFVDGDGVTVSRVYRGRPWFGDSDPIPMISILEAGDPFDIIVEAQSSASIAENDWQLNVQGFVYDDKANPTDPGYRLLADLRQCLAVEAARKINGRQPNPLGFGTGKNKVVSLRFGSGTVRPADDISSKAWLWLPVTLRIVEHASDPYAV